MSRSIEGRPPAPTLAQRCPQAWSMRECTSVSCGGRQHTSSAGALPGVFLGDSLGMCLPAERQRPNGQPARQPAEPCSLFSRASELIHSCYGASGARAFGRLGKGVIAAQPLAVHARGSILTKIV